MARFTRTVAREPATYSAGARLPHDMLGFPRCTFHKDCGAGTGDVLCGNLVPARKVWIPALHVSQRLWCGSRRHIVWEPGSGATCWEAAAKLKEQKRKKAYHKTPGGIKAAAAGKKKQGVQGPAQLQQPDHSTAAPGECKPKAKKQKTRIHLNFNCPVFFFHRGLPISYKVFECHFVVGPGEAFTKHWLGW